MLIYPILKPVLNYPDKKIKRITVPLVSESVYPGFLSSTEIWTVKPRGTTSDRERDITE